MAFRASLVVWLCALVIAGFSSAGLAAAPLVSFERTGASDVELVGEGVADVYVDAGDATVVKKTADLLAQDIERVTGRRPRLMNGTTSLGKQAVIVGTLGKSGVIDALAKAGKIDASKLAGQWESFVLQTVEQPLPGVDRALVIVGSDRRGTAFGVFELSEAIGVSPWYWWADLSPTHRDRIAIKSQTLRFGPPTVKYRGIFINDEDWGLQPWAAKTFDPELGNIGPKTYEKVFELLLRLKGNYLWPAMHHCSTEFGSIARNSELADEWGIVMGASHCEPMNRNNVWWDEKARGPWRWDTNRDAMIHYWEEWAQQRGKYEAVWTVGMRGIHDSPMRFPPDMPGQVKALGEAIDAQRALLKKYVSPDIERVPQVFMPYKEALAHYQAGLKLPDDVTIMWCDDNFGFIRQLSTQAEQKRSGGSGVYYHISYLGRPTPYLWINTTPPALIWTEMHKALANGANRIWVLNVGDIKPGEIGMDFWLRMAWDADHFGPDAQNVFLKEWATREFGSGPADTIADLMNRYYQLGFQRKPELMKQGVFNAVYYDESGQRELAYGRLAAEAQAAMQSLPPEKRDAFFELVLYPIQVAAGANGVFYCADEAQLASMQARPAYPNATVVPRAKAELTRLERDTKRYNEDIAGGKWRDMMLLKGTTRDGILEWPVVKRIEPSTKPAMGVLVEGEAVPLMDEAGGQIHPVDLVAADAKLQSPFELKNENGMNYLVVPNGVGDVREAGKGPSATFDFDIPRDGAFNLFALVHTPTDKDDSYFVKIDDEPWATVNDLNAPHEWAWRKQGVHTLRAGRHRLTIGQREDGTMLATFRLSERETAQSLEELYPTTTPSRLPPFKRAGGGVERTILVFGTNDDAFDVTAKSSAPWIKLAETSLTVDKGQRAIHVSVDWSQVPAGQNASGEIVISGLGSEQRIQVTASGDDVPAGTFYEADRYISIEAEHFNRSTTAKDATKWITVAGLGRAGDAVTIEPANAASRKDARDVTAHSPVLEYDLATDTAGAASIAAYCLPTHRMNGERGLRYGISIDDAPPTIVDFDESGGGSGEQSAEWLNRVSRNIAISATKHTLARPGKHTLKLWMVDPGVVVDKLVIDLGGVKPSELGPPETRKTDGHGS